MTFFPPQNDPYDASQLFGRLALAFTPFGTPFSLGEGGFRLAGALANSLSGKSEQKDKESSRKSGTRAILGGKPVVWDADSKQWLADFSEQAATPPSASASRGAPPAPPVDLNVPPAPALPEPLEKPPATNFPASEGSPLEGQKTDFTFQDLSGLVKELLKEQATLRGTESQREIQRNVITAALRNEGLERLTRRQLQTEAMKGWYALQQAREQARAAQAISLATTAYIAGQPNANVIDALNRGMEAGMKQVTIQAPNVPAGRNLFG
jgi:hypothetical protein